MAKSRRIWTVSLLAIPLLLYTAVVIAPLLSSFYFSLTDWNGFNAQFNFIGLKNFQKITGDPLFANAIKNTGIWMLTAILVPTSFGLALALVLHERIRGANVFKSLFYLPICLSLAVIGQTWIFLYYPDWGLLNQVLRLIGLDALTHAWLAEPQLALPAVMVAWCWQQIGLSMVIFLAGLTTIPTELTEAASMDGANYWQNLRHVVIPLLSPATVVIVALAIINSLKSFDIVYIMTRGGPFHSSDTLAMMMYNESFQKYYMGYGSAISVVLFGMAMIVIGFYFKQIRALEHLYD